MVAHVHAISISAILTRCARALDRSTEDRYDVEQGVSEQDRRDRRMWNGGSEHVERLMREWLLREQTTLARQERIEAGLRELVQAPALDLRLRSALCEVQEGML